MIISVIAVDSPTLIITLSMNSVNFISLIQLPMSGRNFAPSYLASANTLYRFKIGLDK